MSVKICKGKLRICCGRDSCARKLFFVFFVKDLIFKGHFTMRKKCCTRKTETTISLMTIKFAMTQGKD